MAGKTDELWAALRKDGSVQYTTGGSSSVAKLMVGPTEDSVRRSIRSSRLPKDLKESLNVKLLYNAKA